MSVCVCARVCVFVCACPCVCAVLPQALLQTVDREERDMRELDQVRDTLLSHCTTGGRDALTLEVSHLHELRTSSEREARERLAVLDVGPRAREGQQAQRAQHRLAGSPEHTACVCGVVGGQTEDPQNKQSSQTDDHSHSFEEERAGKGETADGATIIFLPCRGVCVCVCVRASLRPQASVGSL